MFQAAGTVVQDGIWRDTDKGLVERLVGSGDPAGDAGETFFGFADFAINGPGRIAFRARDTGSTQVGATSLWAQDTAGDFLRLGWTDCCNSLTPDNACLQAVPWKVIQPG